MRNRYRYQHAQTLGLCSCRSVGATRTLPRSRYRILELEHCMRKLWNGNQPCSLHQ